MNTVYRDGKLQISVHADQAPPHFHARTPGGTSRVDLRTLTEITGTDDRRLLAKAIAWALDNCERSEVEWQQLNGG